MSYMFRYDQEAQAVQVQRRSQDLRDKGSSKGESGPQRQKCPEEGSGPRRHKQRSTSKRESGPREESASRGGSQDLVDKRTSRKESRP